MDDVLQSYRALRDKVDGFATEVAARRGADLACRPGCASCCQVELSLGALEAEVVGRALRALPAARRGVLLRDAQPGACVCLTAEGTCAIYAERPLLCRTQGLPLRYPPGLLPAETVRARARTRGDAAAAVPLAHAGMAGQGDVTWCSLNFTGPPPAAADVLDAERVDLLLALLGRRFAERTGGDPLQRRALRELLREAAGEGQGEIILSPDGSRH